MKNLFALMLCLALIIPLCACGADDLPVTEAPPEKSVTVKNEIRQADIWILPDTEANRKTTVWGSAGAAALKAGESRSVPLCEPGDGGRYLLRMIDTEGYYYSAGEIELAHGDVLLIEKGETQGAVLKVTGASKSRVGTYELFAAKL